MKKLSTVLSVLAAVAALAALGAAVYHYLKQRGEWFCCCDDEDYEDDYCDCGEEYDCCCESEPMTFDEDEPIEE